MGFKVLKETFSREDLVKIMHAILIRSPLIIVDDFKKPEEILQSLTLFSYADVSEFLSGPTVLYFAENLKKEKELEKSPIYLYLGSKLSDEDVKEVISVKRGWVLVLNEESYEGVSDLLDEEIIVFKKRTGEWINFPSDELPFEERVIDETLSEPDEISDVLIRERVKETYGRINIFYHAIISGKLGVDESIEKAGLKREYIPLILKIIERTKFIDVRDIAVMVFKTEETIPYFGSKFSFPLEKSFSPLSKEALIAGTFALVDGEKTIKEIHELLSPHVQGIISEKDILRGYIELSARDVIRLKQR